MASVCYEYVGGSSVYRPVFTFVNLWMDLTHSTPAVPNYCCSKGPAPYCSKPPVLIFNLIFLVLSARVPECQKLIMVG